jgi:hypothetical protein
MAIGIARSGLLRQLLPLLLVSACGGCVEHRTNHSVMRLWGDYNTLNRPAFCCERLTHRPYKPSRVDHFRWMYHRPPGQMAAEAVFIPAPPPAIMNPEYCPPPMLPDFEPPPRRETKPLAPPVAEPPSTDPVPPAPAPGYDRPLDLFEPMDAAVEPAASDEKRPSGGDAAAVTVISDDEWSAASTDSR